MKTCSKTKIYKTTKKINNTLVSSTALLVISSEAIKFLYKYKEKANNIIVDSCTITPKEITIYHPRKCFTSRNNQWKCVISGSHNQVDSKKMTNATTNAASSF